MRRKMLSEEQWLRITQSFTPKPEEIPENERPEPIHKEKCDISLSPKTESSPIEPANVPPEIRMKEFLEKKSMRSKPGHFQKSAHPPLTLISNSIANEVVNGTDSMEWKINTLESRLAEKNRKIEEQEIEIGSLRRKLAVQEITGSLDQGKEKESLLPVTLAHCDLNSNPISERVTKLEAQMKQILSQVQFTEPKNFEASKIKTQVRPRTNLAFGYRIASHAATNSRGSTGTNNEIAAFEEKINNLEKIVDSLKQFLVMIVLRRRKAQA